MINSQTLRGMLNERKGTDQWRQIAAVAGCDYNTIARIARGDIRSPGLDLAARVYSGMLATDRPAAPSHEGVRDAA
jgi:hypothetical protein